MKAAALPKQPSSTTHQKKLAARGWLRPLANAWHALSSRSPRACVPIVEEFETRLLYSADFATSGLALAADSQVVEQRVLSDSGEYVQTQSSQASTTEQKHELLFIDARVPNIDDLVDGLDTEGRSIEIVILDANKDGIEQISAALTGRTDLSAIHIVSHGNNGQLQLGSSMLGNSQLDARSAEISRWGDALNSDGDILLYGCDVAAGADGKTFVQRLAVLTRADVATSDDLTGNTALGGNWNLEYSAGIIESRLAFNSATQSQWQGLLETLANTTLNPTQTNAAVAMNPTTGGFVVTWTSDDADKTGIFARIYNAAGTPISGEIAVNTTTSDNQEFSTIGMAADGSFVVAWQSNNQDGNNYGIYAQRFDAAGAKSGGEILVNQFTNGYQITPSIAVAADGQFVVAWEDNRNGGDIYARHFSNTGVALGNEILVNTNTASGQDSPAITIDSAGNYVVTWKSDSGATGRAIFAQRFNASDVKSGSEFRVNAYDSSDQIDPAIAMAPDGRFVIAWSSNHQDGSGYGIYAQRYAADGTLAGGEFLVNTNFSNHQETATVAMDGSGNFVIAWSSQGQDNSGTLGVYAQKYFANGATNGGEFLVNMTTVIDQKTPSAAMSSAGDLVVAWEGNGAGDSKGIFWQNYVLANNPPVANADTASTDEDTPASSAVPGVLGNDTDPDIGAVLSVTGILAGTTGTATTATAGGVTVTGTYGDLLIRQDGSYTYTPNATTAQALAAGQIATDVFTCTIKDEKNANASSTLTVTINGLNDAPAANADSYAVVKSGTLNVAATGVLGNDTDVDTNPVADTLTVSQVNGLAGNVGAALVGTYGTLTLNADGSLSYTPDIGNPIVSGLVGSIIDNFTYQVSDGKGGTSSTTLNITISGTNTVPVANNDAYTTAEDTSLSIPANGVITNDTDAEGNALTATLVSGVANGALVFNSNGSFSYTPNTNFNGGDSFTYQVSDGSLSSGITTVTLTITTVNDAPVAFNDIGAVNQDATLTVNAAAGVLGNDTDADLGDTHTVTLIEAGASSSVVISGTPGVLTSSYGTLTLSSDGSYSYVADGITSKALGAGQTSCDDFSYTMQDTAGATSSATLTITITGTNDAPTISGITALTGINDTATATPFSGVVIGDVDNPAQTQSVSITLDLAAKGSLSNLGGGVYNAGTGVYTFSGTAAAATTAVQGLVFTPTANRVTPGSTETTTFTISASDGVAAAVTDSTTTVVSTSVNNAPTISGITALTNINDTATATPFSTVTIGDVDSPAQTQTVSITLDLAAKGTLSNLGGGAYNAGTGVYTFSGAASAATTAVQGLVFTPAANRVTPGSTETTTFTISVNDGVAASVTDSTTTVVSTSVNDAPTIGGITAAASINDTTTATPFSAVTIGDVDNPAQMQTVSITLDLAAKGTLSNLGGGAYNALSGVYTFSGTAAAATTAVQGLVFTPAANRVTPGSTETTTFTISVNDGVAAAVTDNTTTVVSTSINDAPTLAGITAATSINDTATATPFSAVTIGDVDNPAQTQTVSITLDLAAKGMLSNLGGGAYNAGAGVYTFSGTAAAATTAVQGLLFTPTANRVTPGSTETTTFTISASDGVAAPVTNNVTTVAVSNVTFLPPIPVPPEPVTQPPEVETTDTTDDTESTTKDSKETVFLPIDAKDSGVLASPNTLLEDSQTSATSKAASVSATSPERFEGARANLNPANAAALFNLDPAMLADFQIGIRGDLPLFDVIASATENHAFIKELDQLREQLSAVAEGEKHIIGASVAAGTGLSIGYVLWLLRGGVLLSSLLSALPAWRFVDPLPVLGSLKDGSDEEDGEAGEDESLESLVGEQPNSEYATPEKNKQTASAPATPEENKNA